MYWGSDLAILCQFCCSVYRICLGECSFPHHIFGSWWPLFYCIFHCHTVGNSFQKIPLHRLDCYTVETLSQHVYTSTSFLVELFPPLCGFLYVCSGLLSQVCKFLEHVLTHTSVSYGLFLLALGSAKLQIHCKVLSKKLLSPCSISYNWIFSKWVYGIW